MDKKTAQTLTLWLKNTNISSDKIAEHFGISGKDKARIAKLASEIRLERNKQWTRYYATR